MIPLVSLLVFAQGPTFELSALTSGAFQRLGAYRPFGVTFSAEKPGELKKAPEMASPKYGFIKIGNHKFLVAMDGQDKLYVDQNANGDLTDDPATDWGMKTVKSYNGKESTSGQGKAAVDLLIDGKTRPCTLGVYEVEGGLGYYCDFALAGKTVVDGKKYDTLYVDESAEWNGKQGTLFLDENGDGKFHPATDLHPAGRPFLLAGKKYELGSTAGHAALKLTSKALPAAVSNDPNEANGLKTGSKALPFEAKTLNGTPVSFPSSFKGKVVMLDFWATWCGPCMGEVPNVVKAYNAYRSKGFEVLGISLDRENAADQVKSVTAKQGMTWEQIYDGNYFKSAIARQYGIQAIPAAYLVDGDTGKILAYGNDLRGEKLAATIEKVLAAKRLGKN